MTSITLNSQPNNRLRSFDDWSDTSETGGSLGSGSGLSVAPVRAQLFLVIECDRPLSGGARYELTDVDEILIGRGRERAATREREGARVRLTIKLPGRSLSAVHARIMREGECWILEDAGSTNGSFVNGHRIERAFVGDSDCIELGHTLFALRVAVPTPADTPQDIDWLEHTPQIEGIFTLHPLLSRDYAYLSKVAASRLSIVLSGETGTGKEVIARAVHRLSQRQGPFVAVNCGALVPNLVESQLFGHAQGAFSGAIRHEHGFVRSADQGTLLLDEAGDLPIPAQASLLRVLQESEVTPVGSPRSVHVDVRVIAATHRPLEQLAGEGRFRQDLRGRLEGHVMRLPSLCERREDLGILIASILARLAPPRFSVRSSAARALFMHDWPLNIRELEQALRRAIALADGATVSREHLPTSVSDSPAAGAAGRSQGTASVAQSALLTRLSPDDQVLWNRLVELLQEHAGNISKVARATGKARTQVQRWMHRLGIDPERYRKRA